MPTVREIVTSLEKLAPPELAEKWDNVGLQVGRYDREVTGLLLALDLTKAVLEEARKSEANLIVTHHPLIFKPLNNLRFDRPGGEVWEEIINGGFIIYAMHTNFDRAADGLNQYLAELLKLEKVVPLEEEGEDYFKLVVFVPEDHAEEVFTAITDAGAGWIGNYSHCTFRTAGVGTFLPREGTNPYLGEKGVLESVPEVRLETILPARNRKSVIKAMLAAHPYEEVAYDLYPLAQRNGRVGLGRVGQLAAPLRFEEFLTTVKQSFGAEQLRWGGHRADRVKKIALLGGNGRQYIHQAKLSGADVFLTSDLGYHDFLLAEQIGLTLIEVGHHTMEGCALPRIKQWLEQDPQLTEEFKQRIYISQSKIKPYNLF